LWVAGFQTTPVAHGTDLALRLIQPPPTVVLMTAEFACLRGGDWMAELARRPDWRDVPVIVATNMLKSVFAESLRRSGVPVLRRPVDREELLHALETIGFPPLSRARKQSPALRRTFLAPPNRSRH
jgi:CheY-like chemotaxis protein